MEKILHSHNSVFNDDGVTYPSEVDFTDPAYVAAASTLRTELANDLRIQQEIHQSYKLRYLGIRTKFGLLDNGELGYYDVFDPSIVPLPKPVKPSTPPCRFGDTPPKATARDHILFQVGIQDVVVKSSCVNHSVKHKAVGGSKRGVIKELTRKAVGRMKLHIRNTSVEHTKAFLTLTYPDVYSTDGALVKKHFDLIKRWLKRHGVKSGIWFLEFQRRGAPHFHCFLPNYPTGGVDAVSLAWYNIVGSGDPKHLQWHKGELSGRPCLEVFRHPHAASAYATKYATKMEQKSVPVGYQNVGRFWGKWGTAFPVWSYIVGAGYESVERGKAAIALFRTRFQTGVALDLWMQRAYASCTMWGGSDDLPELLETVNFGTHYVPF